MQHFRISTFANISRHKMKDTPPESGVPLRKFIGGSEANGAAHKVMPSVAARDLRPRFVRASYRNQVLFIGNVYRLLQIRYAPKKLITLKVHIIMGLF